MAWLKSQLKIYTTCLNGQLNLYIWNGLRANWNYIRHGLRGQLNVYMLAQSSWPVEKMAWSIRPIDVCCDEIMWCIPNFWIALLCVVIMMLEALIIYFVMGSVDLLTEYVVYSPPLEHFQSWQLERNIHPRSNGSSATRPHLILGLVFPSFVLMSFCSF